MKFALRVILKKTKCRTLYFDSKEKQEYWYKILSNCSQKVNILEFYDILEPIGRGGYGVIHYGIHKKSNKPVAIKKISKANLSADDIELQRREIDSMKMCFHLNIVELLDIFEDLDHFYTVMEYYPGGDLYDYMESRGFSLSEERAKTTFKSIVESVNYLHCMGIMHRDLKFENILMSDAFDTAIPKLCDFGLSLVLGKN